MILSNSSKIIHTYDQEASTILHDTIPIKCEAVLPPESLKYSENPPKPHTMSSKSKLTNYNVFLHTIHILLNYHFHVIVIITNMI